MKEVDPWDWNRSYAGRLPAPGRAGCSLSDVVPADRTSYCVAVFTEADVYRNQQPLTCSTFPELFNAAAMEPSVNSLAVIRQSGRLIEGRKTVGGIVLEWLRTMTAAATRVYIRCWNVGAEHAWEAASSEVLRTSDILDSVPEKVGDFEMFDDRESVYLRFRDDDPLVFIMANTQAMDDILRRDHAKTMRVPLSFWYTIPGAH